MDFTFLPILQYGPNTDPSFGELLDEFYETRERTERTRQRGEDLLRSVKTARERTARKLENQRKELVATQDRERLRELGDILTTNLHALEKGRSTVKLQDYYDPEGREVEIAVDPLLTPQQNEEGYRLGSALGRTGSLKGKLLIASGSNDDNVHFVNTLQFTSKLTSEGKLCDMMVFSGWVHSLRMLTTV